MDYNGIKENLWSDTIMLPYQKMQKVRKLGFVAKCDCGHEHKFKSYEIDLSKSNATTVILKDIYTCPNCGIKYDGIFENIVNRHRKYSPLGISVSILLVFGLLYGGLKLIYPIFNPPAYTNINDATNKQMNDFYKWDNQQQKQKRDNQPAFNNGQ